MPTDSSRSLTKLHTRLARGLSSTLQLRFNAAWSCTNTVVAPTRRTTRLSARERIAQQDGAAASSIGRAAQYSEGWSPVLPEPGSIRPHRAGYAGRLFGRWRPGGIARSRRRRPYRTKVPSLRSRCRGKREAVEEARQTDRMGETDAVTKPGDAGGRVPTNRIRTPDPRREHARGGLPMTLIVRSSLIALTLALLSAGVATAQFPLLDLLAEKVVEKYTKSTCEQLWQERGKPKSAQEQEVITMLRGDAQMRNAFINKVAAPVANRMFECGMIP
jgi:hypothetical protein